MNQTRKRLNRLHIASLLLLAMAVAFAGSYAVEEVCEVVDEARPRRTVYFDQGRTGLHVSQAAGLTNESCGVCHPKALHEWRESRHRVAGTNANFRAQFLHEVGGRQQWCLNCHVPFNPGADLLPTDQRLADVIDHGLPSWMEPGVDCRACHLRDGLVLASRVTARGQAAHPMQAAPELAESEFCAGCHQFSHKDDILPDYLFGAFQQASLSEFSQLEDADLREYRCQDCHMHDGHQMPGGYSDDMLANSVELDVSAKWDSEHNHVLAIVSVTGGNVGHRIPGGEPFRFLTLTTALKRRTSVPAIETSKERVNAEFRDFVPPGWPRHEQFRRPTRPFELMRDQVPDPVVDTRLWPGETRTFRYRIPVSRSAADDLHVRAELQYHILSSAEQQRFGLTDLKMVRTIHAVQVDVTYPSELP